MPGLVPEARKTPLPFERYEHCADSAGIASSHFVLDRDEAVYIPQSELRLQSPNSRKRSAPFRRQELIQLRGVEVRQVSVADIRQTTKAHGCLQFIFQEIHQVLDARSSVVHGVHERPTQADPFGTETERFQDVGAASDAAVDVDFHLAEDLGTVAVQFEQD